MAADLERLGSKFKGDKFKSVRDTLMAQAAQARQLGAPEHFSTKTKIVTEQTEELTLREKFTDVERESLMADGALFYTPKGETIPAQRESRAKNGKPSLVHIVCTGVHIIAVPSKQVEVAIYPDPYRFFVPCSFNKDVKQQDELVAEDAVRLRRRLSLEDIGEIVPSEASTVTDIIFQHLDSTGDWLFGKKYAEAQNLSSVNVCGRTKNPTDSFGSTFAIVGCRDLLPSGAVAAFVSDWDRDGDNPLIGAIVW